MQPMQTLIQNNQLIHSGSPVNQEQELSNSITSNKVRENYLSVVDHLFLKLAAIYGNAWKNLYKSSDFLQFSKQEWLESLVVFEVPHIYAAIALCRESYRFPPSIPEFVECCRRIKKRASPFYKREPNKKATPSIAESNLAQIKAILNIKKS